MWNLRAWTPVRSLADWHVSSQHVSRRNALVASTALADRRRELIEVETFLEKHLASRKADPNGFQTA